MLKRTYANSRGLATGVRAALKRAGIPVATWSRGRISSRVSHGIEVKEQWQYVGLQDQFKDVPGYSRRISLAEVAEKLRADGFTVRESGHGVYALHTVDHKMEKMSSYTPV